MGISWTTSCHKIDFYHVTDRTLSDYKAGRQRLHLHDEPLELGAGEEGRPGEDDGDVVSAAAVIVDSHFVGEILVVPRHQPVSLTSQEYMKFS